MITLAQAGVAGAPVSLAVDGNVIVENLLVLAAAVVVAARARTAPADEVRRIVIFSVGFLMHTGVAVAYNAAEVFRPGDWVSNFDRSWLIVGRELLRFPGLLLLWYSALTVRVLHPREVARACRRVLVRPGLLEATGIAAAGALGLLVTGDPGRAVGAVITDPLALALFATAGVLLLAALARGPILRPPQRLGVPGDPGPAACAGRRVRAAGAGGGGRGRPPDGRPRGQARVRIDRRARGRNRSRSARRGVPRARGQDQTPPAEVGNRAHARIGRRDAPRPSGGYVLVLPAPAGARGGVGDRGGRRRHCPGPRDRAGSWRGSSWPGPASTAGP